MLGISVVKRFVQVGLMAVVDVLRVLSLRIM
jgi:hypothetical protein